MSEPIREELAVCQEPACGWRDGVRGARGRGRLHHNKTGHEVSTSLVTRWPRTGPSAGQTSFLPPIELEAEDIAAATGRTRQEVLDGD